MLVIITQCLNLIRRCLFQLKYILKWYCKRADLHGLNYVTDKRLSIFTRIFFMVMICVSSIFCGYLIMLQLTEDSYQITTTVASTSYPVWKVRFPSVTICNYNLVHKKSAEVLFDIIEHHDIEEDSFNDFLYNLSALITNRPLGDLSHYKKIYDVLEEHGFTTDKLMKKLAQPCDDILKKCVWQLEELSCNEIFAMVKTSLGYCCSFNYYGMRNELGNVGTSIWYEYAKGAGSDFSLQLVIDMDEDKYLSSIRPAYGGIVLIQDAIHYPNTELGSNTLSSSEEVTISISPKIFTASEDIRVYDPTERCCWFEDEGQLEWTNNKYSYTTCASECKARAIIKLCNCIPFYYPVWDGTRICTLFDVSCLHHNLYNVNALNIKGCYTTMPTVNGKNSGKRSLNTTECHCFPQCNEIMYDIYLDKITKRDKYEDKSNRSKLTVYYNTYGCTRIEKIINWTWTEILAMIGGIFGFCLGGSIVSVIEWLYFVISKTIIGRRFVFVNESSYLNDRYHYKLYIREQSSTRCKTAPTGGQMGGLPRVPC